MRSFNFAYISYTLVNNFPHSILFLLQFFSTVCDGGCAMDERGGSRRLLALAFRLSPGLCPRLGRSLGHPAQLTHLPTL